MSRVTRDGTAETVSRDQILRHERGQGNINFPCSAGHEQDWQPHPVDPYSCYMCDHTYVVAIQYMVYWTGQDQRSIYRATTRALKQKTKNRGTISQSTYQKTIEEGHCKEVQSVNMSHHSNSLLLKSI